MGFYINPPDMSKEDWLRQNGERVDLDNPEKMLALASLNKIPPDYYPVCWVNNGPFTAAAVAYSPDEHQSLIRGFVNGTDLRPHQWYVVPKAKLIEVCPTLEGVLL